MARGVVTAVIGMQYGSEGKGVIAELLGHISQVAIRVGGPNAGHTITYKDGKFAMRHIPCAWTNPNCILLIGPAGMVHPDILEEEIAMVEMATHIPLEGRLFIHENVIPITEAHVHMEHKSEFDKRFGSTREGVGAATADRALRSAMTINDFAERFGKYNWLKKYIISPSKYMDYVHGTYDRGGRILLEGTQGHELSLYHGPYPFCTSRDTSVSSLAGGCGVAPVQVREVIGVARTFPIRVAGNSGPLPYETTFDEIGVESERTTVTKKVRRVARFDWDQLLRAYRINRPTGMAITFLDYLREEDRQSFVKNVEKMLGIPVEYCGLGPDTFTCNGGGLIERAIEAKNS